MRPGSPRLALAIATLAAIIAAAAWSLVASMRDEQRMARPDVIAEGNAAAVRARLDGDAYRPYPRWFADARVGLDRLPILMGDPVDPWELRHHQRLVQLVSKSHVAEADAEASRLGLSALEVLFDGDRYLVRRGTLPAPTVAVVWDGLDTLDSASVAQRSTEGEVDECTLWHRDAWHCGRPSEWIYVGRSMREMGDQNPHRCIIANLPEAGRTWVIRWRDVPAMGGTLRWRAGNEYMAIRSERGQPVQLQVFLDDEQVYSHTFGIHDETYAAIEVPMPETPTADVRFELRTSDHFDRFFCFLPQVIVAAGEASAR